MRVVVVGKQLKEREKIDVRWENEVGEEQHE
jgi:hypothetical protein